MWDFLERLTRVALPRIRDFRGVPGKSFDGRGNYTLGLREQLAFPEIDYDRIDRLRGLEVTHRHDGADRRGVQAPACPPRHAVRQLTAQEDGRMAKKSMIAKAKRDPSVPGPPYHRCFLCGRPRAYMRRFAMCRICFRERALLGELPGVTKSSW